MTTFTNAPFQPAPILSNAHLQTFAAGLLRRPAFVPKVEPWFISVAGEKNQIRCDCSWQSGGQKATTALICHGLGGSRASPIVVGLAGALWKACMCGVL